MAEFDFKFEIFDLLGRISGISRPKSSLQKRVTEMTSSRRPRRRDKLATAAAMRGEQRVYVPV
jgi:hypothetical protein